MIASTRRGGGRHGGEALLHAGPETRRLLVARDAAHGVPATLQLGRQRRGVTGRLEPRREFVRAGAEQREQLVDGMATRGDERRRKAGRGLLLKPALSLQNPPLPMRPLMHLQKPP